MPKSCWRSRKSVALALAEAYGHLGLHRVEAFTAPENIGSQLVLVKNGFQLVGRVPRHFQFHGVWEDSVLFSKANPEDQ